MNPERMDSSFSRRKIHNYEIILLGLGVALFVVLLFLLIFSVVKKRPLKGLFVFFILPIVMIGFPGIQKIKFESNGAELDKTAAETRRNPTPENKKLLAAKIGEIEKQPNLSESRKKQITMLSKEFNLRSPP